MQTSDILQAIHDRLIALQEVKSGKLEELATRLFDLREYCDATISRIERGEAETALDLDFHIDDELVLAKQAIREIYRTTSALRGKDTLPAVEVLHRTAKQAYASATNLQWEIGEHDISYCPPKSGYTASSIEELNKVLDRIESEG
jgi:hypothetical protein